MEKVRLFGLVLIMTTMFLGLAAMASQTMEIRLRRPGYADLNPVALDNPAEAVEVEFVKVPIIIPLGVAGLLGLVFWFLPEVALPSKGNRPRTRRRRPRRRRSSFKIRL